MTSARTSEAGMMHWRDNVYSDGSTALNLDGEAFRFGAGLFETLYFNGVQLCHLPLHLARLHDSLAALNLAHAPLLEQPTAAIIARLLHTNGLQNSPARVNIYVFPDAPDNAPCSVLITTRPHCPPPDQMLRLAICPDHHLSPLAHHKTMNYAFHAMALRQAQRNNRDSALLTDASGHVLETNSSALVFKLGDQLVTPASQPRLPSTALATAQRVQSAQPGPPIKEQIIHLHDLQACTHAYALNSIMGMRPVISIGEVQYKADTVLCDTITRHILCLEE